jgi:hypothetical protein
MPNTADSRGLNLPYPALATSPADVPDWLSQLANRLIAIAPVLYVQTTAATRPTSTPGSPGIQGRFHYATDTGALSYDFGTGWIPIGTVSQQYVDDTSFANAIIFGG